MSGLGLNLIRQALQEGEGEKTHLVPTRTKMDALVQQVASVLTESSSKDQDQAEITATLKDALFKKLSSSKAASWLGYFTLSLNAEPSPPFTVLLSGGQKFKLTPEAIRLLASHTGYFEALIEFRAKGNSIAQEVDLKEIPLESFQLLLTALDDPKSVLNKNTSLETIEDLFWLADYFSSSLLTENCWAYVNDSFDYNWNKELTLGKFEELHESYPSDDAKKWFLNHLWFAAQRHKTKESFEEFAKEYGHYLTLLTFNKLADDSWLALLSYFPNLEELELRFNDAFTDAGLEHLKVLKSLKSLDLGKTKITGAGLEHLEGQTELTTLSLYSCTELTDAGLGHLKGLKTLTDLNLNRCNKITDAGLEHLKGLTALSRLGINDCFNIGAEADNYFRSKGVHIY